MNIMNEHIIRSFNFKVPKEMRLCAKGCPPIAYDEPFLYQAHEIDELMVSLTAQIGLEVSRNSAIVVNTISVAAHVDDYVGALRTKHSLFIVTHFGRNKGISLQVLDETVTLRPNDNNAVIFKDGVLHSVSADYRWRGYAVQVNMI